METYTLVLCHDIEKNGNIYSLTNQTRDRTNAGISLLNQKKVTKLIISGGCEHLYGFSISGLMKDYAISKNVDINCIIEENLSRDTAGQLIFSKLGILKPRGIKNVILITSDYHVPRVKEESQFIFGPEYNLFFYMVPCDEKERRSEEQEKRSLESFWKTFEGISPGDDERILIKLLEKHPFYIGEADKFRKRLEKLIKNEIPQG